MLHTWDIYQITADSDSLHGVKLRGRIRKFVTEKEITCIVENASDEENTVRFALLAGTDSTEVSTFIKNLLPKASVVSVLKDIPNPVLSKLKVNDSSRYEI